MATYRNAYIHIIMQIIRHTSAHASSYFPECSAATQDDRFLCTVLHVMPFASSVLKQSLTNYAGYFREKSCNWQNCESKTKDVWEIWCQGNGSCWQHYSKPKLLASSITSDITKHHKVSQKDVKQQYLSTLEKWFRMQLHPKHTSLSGEAIDTFHVHTNLKKNHT
jgi:hypothetical protein